MHLRVETAATVFTRRYRKGLEILEMILILNPGSGEEIKQRAWLRYELGLYKQARADLETYLAMGPPAEDIEDVKKWIVMLQRTQARMN